MSWKHTTSVKLAQETPGVSDRHLDIPTSPHLDAVLQKLHDKGHKALIVGGAVRDAMLGEKPKDVDVEVYGTNYDELADTLKPHGKVNLVGKAFGVVKFTDHDKNEYDFSLPRRDNKTGVGHKDFETEFDPDITPREAASRRDFTFNALAYDPVEHKLHDYFGGEKDLKNKTIRHTSEAFAEDPLRVLRGMQFSARYGMDVHPDTAKLAHSIKHEYSTIPKERVGEEFMKLATKGKEPGRAVDYLQKTGWHENFPALHALHGLPQDKEWHPEGDVATHTAHSMNAAAKIADREGLQGDDRAVTVFGAMCHDMGKPSTTKEWPYGYRHVEPPERESEWEENGGWRRPTVTSHGHDEAGEPIARKFLDDIGIKPDITNKVAPIVREHMQHINYTGEPAEGRPAHRVVRRLAQRLAPASIKDLSRVVEADHSGRPPLEGGMPSGMQRILDKAEDSHVTDKPMDKIINGRDVMPYFDNKPGRHIGEHVNAAYEAQLNGEISTREEGLDWLKKRMSKTAALPATPPPEHVPDEAIEMVDPNKLIPFAQDGVNWDDVRKITGPIREPIILTKGKGLRVDDGHHRMYNAAIRGIQVPAAVWNMNKRAWEKPSQHIKPDPDPPPKTSGKVFHVAPAEARESIEQHGLDTGRLRDVLPDYEPSTPGRIHVFKDEDEADWYRGYMERQEPVSKMDIWQVDADDNELEPDRGLSSSDEETSAHSMPDAVHPSRIKRIAMPRDEDWLKSLEFEHTQNADAHTISAWHPGGDTSVGSVRWSHESLDSPPTVTSIDVESEYQRHGLGTELLHRAKQMEPNLHHDSTLMPDGRRLVDSIGDQASGLVTAGENAPKTMYHVSLLCNKSSILKHGIDSERAWDSPWADTGDLEGNFLWQTESRARRYATQIGHHCSIFRVNATGLDLIPDRTAIRDDDDDLMGKRVRSAWIANDPITRDRVEHVGDVRTKSPWHDEDCPMCSHERLGKTARTISADPYRAYRAALRQADEAGPEGHLATIGRPGQHPADSRTRAVARDYMASQKMPYDDSGEDEFVAVDEARGKRIAEAFEDAPHNPQHPTVVAAYQAFKHETRKQYDHLKSHGYEMTPWAGEGQPYENSAQFTADVRNNRSIKYFKTVNPDEVSFGAESGGDPKDNPLLEDADRPATDTQGNTYHQTFNDLFRAVHDIYGHAKEGNQTGPRGEENAWRQHARMYSPLARRAMTTETRGQNSFVNFGRHLRRPDDSLPTKGQPDYVDLQNRPYADQKVTVLPPEFSELHHAQDNQRVASVSLYDDLPSIKRIGVKEGHRFHFHVSDADNEDSIKEHGLDFRKGLPVWPRDANSKPGNYLYQSEEEAENYIESDLDDPDEERFPLDQDWHIWKVDTKHYKVHPDPEEADWEKNDFDPHDPPGWRHVIYEPIKPEHVQRVGSKTSSEEKVTLYRGTTEKSWNRAKERGEFSHDPNWHTSVAREVEQHYGLPEGAIANHDYYQFNGDFRKTDNQLYVAGNPEDAARYAWSGNEPYEDALHTAHRIVHADLYDALDAKVDDDSYTKEDAQALKNHKEVFVQKYHEDTGTRPVVLKMEVPKSLAYPEPTRRGEVRHLKLTRPFPASYVTDVTYPDRPKPFFSTKKVTGARKPRYMVCGQCRGKGRVWDDCPCTFNPEQTPDPNCPKCKGKGEGYTDFPCVWCNGSGLAPSCAICGGQGFRHYNSDEPDEWVHPFKPKGKERDFPKHQFQPAVTTAHVTLAAKSHKRLMDEASGIEGRFGPDQSKVVHTFDDNWTIRQLQTEADKFREGRLMSNCWDLYKKLEPNDLDVSRMKQPLFGPGYDEEQSVHYSLRDPDNIPHVSFFHGLDKPGVSQSLHGAHNKPIKPQYLDRIRDWNHGIGGRLYPDHFNEKVASWRDVRDKAVRLRNANLVDIIRLDSDVIAARVQGDHHMYDVVLYRQYPDSWSITMWECSCKWGDWAFKRQVTYVGRFCSHALATLYEAHGMEYKTGSKTANVGQDEWLHKGKPFSFALVDLRDGVIEKIFPYHQAKEGDFHHSYVLEPQDANKVDEGTHDYIWMDDGGDPQSMRGVEPRIRGEIRKQIEPAPKEARVKLGMAFEPNREHYKADWSELPDKVYHVAPASARQSITEHGLDPTGRTHNLALSEHDQAEGGHWKDNYYHGKGSENFHYRPEGVYAFAAGDTAAAMAKWYTQRRGEPQDVWEINTDSLRAHQHLPEHKTDVIRDPEMFQQEGPDDPEERTREHDNDYSLDHGEQWDPDKIWDNLKDYGDSIGEGSDYRSWAFEKVHPQHIRRVKPYTLKHQRHWTDDDTDDYMDDHPEDDDDEEYRHSSKTGALGRGTLVFFGTSQPIKVDVEVARDAQSIQQGLMNRTFLGPRSGMAFVYPYPPSYSGFWMKNTLIPLSVAFWDREGRIIEIKDMQPCTSGDRCPTYQCSKPYWGAVEVNLGFFRQWGIGPGTRVELHL